MTNSFYWRHYFIEPAGKPLSRFQAGTTVPPGYPIFADTIRHNGAKSLTIRALVPTYQPQKSYDEVPHEYKL